jgi:hypothetical protein
VAALRAASPLVCRWFIGALTADPPAARKDDNKNGTDDNNKAEGMTTKKEMRLHAKREDEFRAQWGFCYYK